MTGVTLGTVAVLLLLSALLTALGAAVLQVGASRIRALQDEGFTGAPALAELRGDEGRTRMLLRLVTRALNLAAVGIATIVSSRSWGALPALGMLVGGIVVVLLITDVLPRFVAARHPVRLALLASPPLLALRGGMGLLMRPLARLESAFFPGGLGDETAGVRELRELQELGTEEGVLEEHESLLVERALHLDELTAWDVMTPRVDVFAWKESLTLDAIAGQLSSVPYSRVPVYRDSVDDISGVLYVREAYQALVDGKRALTLAALAREPFFVPGSLSLSRLLKDFQTRRIHMGFVADEFGGIDGLVTMEDVLEELVGDIMDETDVDLADLVRLSRTEALADAGVDLREINYAFNLSLPTLEHRSLNGFILEELGRVPSVGDALERSGVRIEIVESTETQVVRARLTRLPTGPEPTTLGGE
ncbi:MAG TPA: CNNM domain-containing protein [Longimicrobiales bacterium]|nr:CNNM domain-containing protein [Longimicrobiales bacterium]